MLTGNEAILRYWRAGIVARYLRRSEDWLRRGQTALWPLFELALRLWLAQTFWVSGVLKLANWNSALTLATYEYPVSWLDPATAAILGVVVEVGGSMLLALGLATRPAALALLALSLVIQFEYQPLNEHLYWAALFTGYVAWGAGPLSLDRVLGPGLAASALPLARPLSQFYTALTRYCGPLYLLGLRLGLAAVFFAPIMAGRTALDWTLSFAAPFLALGLATRPVALLALLGGVILGFSQDLTALQRIDHGYWLLFLTVLLLRGSGPLALDHLFRQQLHRLFPPIEDWGDDLLAGLPHVVIIGAGFGGLKAARGLRNAPCRITVLDKRNYHLFQPLLYQVATASLSPADIATPIRALFRDQPNARVLLGEAVDVDTAARQVVLRDGSRIAYDYLVLATGAQHSYFGRDDWAPYAPGLKQVEDATAIRRRLLLAFEQAENCADLEERQRLLTFVIVGGGPTGVELAGAIAELARHGLAGEFRNINPAEARVLLVQSAPRLLPAFPESLSAVSERSLRNLGIEVLTRSRVEQVDAAGVVVSGQRIGARTVFWAAGVAASPAAGWIKGEADAAGRLKVGPDLSAPALSNVFAIGDTALSTAWEGQPVPGLAPAAKQEGTYVARVIAAQLEGRAPPPPFRYRHFGNLATIGRQAAVVDFGRLRLHGALAWWLWGVAHVLFLVEMRKRLAITLEWFWAYLTFRRGTRLITGGRE
ncbi:MAG: FAD-dependent oxidoreductase [Candidatus Competibacteraceae bacterium]